MARERHAAGQSGFTLVEVMVAMLLMLVGVLGTMALVDAANATTTSNRAREGGTNLAREVLEDARGIAFPDLAGDLAPQLQARPGLADSDAGSAGWQVERRGIAFTVTATACAVDDAKDGLGAHVTGFCAGSAGTADRDPEDYKRVTVGLSWTPGTGARRVRLTGVVASPGSGAGVGIAGLAASTTEVTTATSVALTLETKRRAARVEWAVDGAIRQAQTGDRTDWTWSWAVGDLLDGVYLLSAQAFDGFDRSAGARSVTISVNRRPPAAVTGAVAARAGSGVTITWDPSAEGDVIGYTVYRVEAGVEVAVAGCRRITVTKCTDIPGGSSYRVVAIDRSGGALREGTPVAVTVPADATPEPPLAENHPPTAPGPLEKKTSGSRANLSWTAAADPDPGDAVAAYRIYRDGALVAQTSSLTYAEYPGDRALHRYSVTAVDTRGAESTPSYEPGYTP